MGVVGGGLGRDEPDPQGHPLHVSVDRHEWQSEREEQQYGGRLLADAIDAGQPVAGIERRHLAQEVE